MKRYLDLKIYFPEDEIEFQINSKEVEGIVSEVNMRFNKEEGKVIWYEVLYNNKIYIVDGETFQIIKS